MSKISEIASLYKTPPPHSEKDVEGNSFTNMILNTKQTASEAFDKLAWFAGIKPPLNTQ